MSAEWQPGDVAMVRLDPETEIRVMYNGASWIGRKGTFYDLHSSARPLVVIDPEDREQVERLVRSFWNAQRPDGGSSDFAYMQAALRSLTEPPKPEEPIDLAARVFDAMGLEWAKSGRGCWFSLRGDHDCCDWGSLLERGPLEVKV